MAESLRGFAMGTTTTEVAITISLTDLENLIRRVVREELARLPRTSAPSILDDWSHEGPEDPAGDEELLAEALAVLEEYGDKPETWMKWEDFTEELARAEASGELPD
jgi:hypothetical protein